MKSIYTKRFVLRPPSVRDIDDVQRYAHDKTIHRNTSNIPYPYTKQIAREWILKCQRRHRMRPPRDIVWLINIDGEAVGSIGLHSIAHRHKAEIGYWLGKPFRGQGVMTDAVMAVCAYAQSELGLAIVYAYAYAYNPASAKVLTKNGFIKRGTLPKFAKKDGQLHDDQIYILEL